MPEHVLDIMFTEDLRVFINEVGCFAFLEKHWLSKEGVGYIQMTNSVLSY